MLTAQGVSRYILLQCNSRTALQSVPLQKRKLVLFNPKKTGGWKDSPPPSPSCSSAWILLLHLMAQQCQALQILLALHTGAEPKLGGEWRGNRQFLHPAENLRGRIPPAPLRQASSHDVLTHHSPLSQVIPRNSKP